MPIIAHTTDKKLNILNTDTFVIDGFSQFYHKASKTYLDIIDISTVTEDGKKINSKKISPLFFNKYFYLGFCITIHASQGETYKTPYTIYDWNFYHFSNKAKYVALSRATDIQNIQIQQ